MKKYKIQVKICNARRWLKISYHGFQREDGQYGLHSRNRQIEVSFSRKIWTYEFQELTFHPLATRA